MTADQWIQVGIFLMMGGANAAVLLGIVNKNSRASGELSATVKSFEGAVKEFKESVNGSIKELFASRLKHESDISALKTAVGLAHTHHRAEDEET